MERKKRGFGSMSKDKQREIASLGGKAAHALGRGHEWTPEQARAAGSLGGKKRAEQSRRQREAASR